MVLEKYSVGIGDRFAKEGDFQLKAFLMAKEAGVLVTPVWNKSYREHKTVGTQQSSVRAEADASVESLAWKNGYFVDADHITFETVDEFLPFSDFFTIDVASQIGEKLSEDEVDELLVLCHESTGSLTIPGIEQSFELSQETIHDLGNKFYKAVKEAQRIYHKISREKSSSFAVEVSMDEVDAPQSPKELYFILMLLGKVGVPVNTIAPKFTGRFNKGVDYQGDIESFEKEFEEDLMVIRYCVKQYGLPKDLKLSIHTGSDKFSLYPIMNRLVKKHASGLHLKTAGTTWLEELIGLAESEGSGLDIAKRIYSIAYGRFEELTDPYATVIDVDKSALPTPETILTWEGKRFAKTLRHDPNCQFYDQNFRQFLHTSYKVAAEMGKEFIIQLEKNSLHIGRNVTANIFDRHIKPLFL